MADPAPLRVTSKVNRQGRLVIPAEAREAAGIAPNTVVVIEVDKDRRLHIKPALAEIEEAQALVRKWTKPGPSVVDELVRERRAEAERE